MILGILSPVVTLLHSVDSKNFKKKNEMREVEVPVMV